MEFKELGHVVAKRAAGKDNWDNNSWLSTCEMIGNHTSRPSCICTVPQAKWKKWCRAWAGRRRERNREASTRTVRRLREQVTNTLLFSIIFSLYFFLAAWQKRRKKTLVLEYITNFGWGQTHTLGDFVCMIR